MIRFFRKTRNEHEEKMEGLISVLKAENELLRKELNHLKKKPVAPKNDQVEAVHFSASNGRRKENKKPVLMHLKKHGSITSAQAWHLYKCTHLPSVIFRLRNEGHLIKTEMMEGDKKVRYAQYFYVHT